MVRRFFSFRPLGQFYLRAVARRSPRERPGWGAARTGADLGYPGSVLRDLPYLSKVSDDVKVWDSPRTETYRHANVQIRSSSDLPASTTLLPRP